MHQINLCKKRRSEKLDKMLSVENYTATYLSVYICTPLFEGLHFDILISEKNDWSQIVLRVTACKVSVIPSDKVVPVTYKLCTKLEIGNVSFGRMIRGRV